MQLNKWQAAIGRWLAAGLSLCLLVTTSCTHLAEVPPGSIEDTDVSAGTWYRIETTDGHEYLTNDVTRTETAFVIHMLRKKVEGRHWEKDFAVDAIEVPFDQVASMKVREHSNGRTAWLVVGTLAIMFVAAMSAVADSINLSP